MKKNGAINKSIQTSCQETGEVIGGAGSSDPIYYPKTFTLSKTKFKYSGKVQYPTVKVVGSNGKTIAASNYTVTYSNKKSKNVGAYTITIKFKGSYYSGTQKLTYYIIPKGVTLKSLSAAKKALTAKWTKNATQTTGYQILVATDKNFTKNKKAVKVKNVKTLTKKITGLKAKTKYWVAVRTYKTVGKVTIYSAWSNIKTIKTK